MALKFSLYLVPYSFAEIPKKKYSNNFLKNFVFKATTEKLKCFKVQTKNKYMNSHFNVIT